MGDEAVLRTRNLTKEYISGDRRLRVLEDISFDMTSGGIWSVVGPSGSGKTTLLGLCAGLDHPSAGSVTLCGVDLGPLSEDERARVRSEHVGFVFQTFQLIPTLTALENVMVPGELRGDRFVRDRAEDLMADVGLHDRMHHYPAQLSGGEKQRVAIARAFINRPRILFADEPTGNLDAETGERIEELLFSLNETAGTSLLLVTHDERLAARTERRLRLRGGRLVESEAIEHAGSSSTA